MLLENKDEVTNEVKFNRFVVVVTGFVVVFVDNSETKTDDGVSSEIEWNCFVVVATGFVVVVFFGYTVGS